MSMYHGHPMADLVILSMAVTFVYAAFTWLIYQITRGVKTTGLVRFLARNTLFVFIVHMPIYYALQDPLARRAQDYWVVSPFR